MKIGIISDSHDHMENIKKAVQIFQDRKVGYVIHLGDYVNPASVKLFQGIHLIGIFGNNDGDKYRLMRSFQEIGGEMKGDFLELQEGGLKIACYHGTEPQIREALIASEKYEVVLYGHTHSYEDRYVKKTRVLNPGTAHGFWKEASVMIFDMDTLSPEMIRL